MDNEIIFLILIWLMIFFNAQVATLKNRDYWDWFVLSMVITPFLALFILIVLGDGKKEKKQ